MYFVGIDVGGTKSDFLLCDENENEISRVILGAGNPNDIGIDECITLLGEGLDALCGDITPVAVFAGVSGAGYGEYAVRVRDFLKKRFPNSIIENGPDALNLIYCSRSKNAGALICGTGSLLFLRVGGKLLRFGGWGHLFDDGGSGYDIGRDALRHLLDCEERMPSLLNTPLCSLLRARLSSSAHDSIADFYARGKAYIASFAPIAFEAYEAGDEAALAIISANVETVARRIELAIESLAEGEQINEIICAGGLFNSPVFYAMLAKRVDTPLTLLTVAPSLGACRRAIDLFRGNN